LKGGRRNERSEKRAVQGERYICQRIWNSRNIVKWTKLRLFKTVVVPRHES